MDRYDFPYRPDMQPGARDPERNDDQDFSRPRVPTDVKIAVALFAFAVLASFGIGAKLGALAQQTQSAEACQPH
jgi:hypothetical protein